MVIPVSLLLNAARELVELLRNRRDYSGRNIVLVYLGISLACYDRPVNDRPVNDRPVNAQRRGREGTSLPFRASGRLRDGRSRPD